MPILKIHFQTTGDVRRMTVPDWPDLPGLHGLLTSMFGAELPMPYTLKYTDPDGDLISITSTPELREAVSTAGRSGVLNLFVGVAVAGSSASISLAAMPRVTSAPSMLPSSSPTPSPHSIQLPDFSSVAMSQAHDTLFIDDLAPAQFVADFRQLLQMNYGWEQTRDALIDYGGDVSLARAALRAGPRRPSTPTSRHYFSVAFARAAVDLSSKAGFPIRDVVAALIRNAGVAANALTELSSQAADLRCPSGHPLEVSSYNLGDYATQWYCNRCRKADKPGQRWFCLVCKYDVCFACQPAPRVPTTPSLYPSPSPSPSQPPLISDMSLPPTLLQPVKVLEAMGFTDRALVIEALVAAQGDIVRAATQLADQRRIQEEKEAKEARRRRLAEERAERQRQEAERREAEARQRAIEAKRQEAAKVVVHTPEKIGSDLAYLLGMGFDPVSSTSSLFNAGGNVQEALEELLRAQSRS